MEARPKRSGGIVDLEEVREIILDSIDCEDVLVQTFAYAGTDIVVATVFVLPGNANKMKSEQIHGLLSSTTKPDLVLVSEDLGISTNGKLETPFRYAQKNATASSDTDSYLYWLAMLIIWMGFEIDGDISHVGLMDIGSSSIEIVGFRNAITILFKRSIDLTDLYQCSSMLSVAKLIETLPHEVQLASVNGKVE